jgi:hypothetical protein
MFTPEEFQKVQHAVQTCALRDRTLLDRLREEVKKLEPVRKIQPRSATSVSLVASDGGNNQLRFDPFHVQLIRVVDSYGKQLCLDAVSASTDLDELDKAQFNRDGTPRTALGRMMRDLGTTTLHGLSHFMPKPGTPPDEISGSWVQVYRDLCEWAVLYELICHGSFSTDTLIVRDGLLRTKMYRKDNFIRLRLLIEAAIERIRIEHRRRVFLVGVAKHTKVLERLSLAMALEQTFPAGEPLYVEVGRQMERDAVDWGADVRGPEEAATGKELPGKFIAGTLYFVRFGPYVGDPTWSVDILTAQKDHHQEIFGYLQQDALHGFPVPFYPMCLQRAHNFAQIVDFDQDILADTVIKAVRDVLPKDKHPIFDALPLRQDVAQRRYS